MQFLFHFFFSPVIYKFIFRILVSVLVVFAGAVLILALPQILQFAWVLIKAILLFILAVILPFFLIGLCLPKR